MLKVIKRNGFKRRLSKRLKRPLCFYSILFIMICMAHLQIGKAPPPDFSFAEGRKVTLAGKVLTKERKTTFLGEVLLITIQPMKYPEESFTSALSYQEKSIIPELSYQEKSIIPELSFQEKSIIPKLSYQEELFTASGIRPGKVICYLEEDSPAPPIGSTIQIQGKLSCFERATNPGQFSQADYYRILKTDYRVFQGKIIAQSRSCSRYRESLYRIRVFCGQTLDRYFSKENASILRTMLLGESGQTDAEIKGLYQRNGIVHILAISGLHISLLGMGLYRLLRKLSVPIPAASPAAIAVMYSYGIMTSQSTSSLRAIVMFGMHMAAHLLGRTYDLLTALAVAAVLILAEQPLYLQHSGFLFSFLAVLAIGLFIPAMNDQLPMKIPWKKKCAEAFLSGFCISAFTLPVYAYFYYQFPLYSLLLNLLVIPLMSILMVTGIMTISVGSIFTLGGKIPAAVSTWILAFYEKLCLLCDRMPFHNLITGKPQTWRMVLYAGILFFLILSAGGDRKRKLAAPLRYLILVCGIPILLWRAPTGLAVTFLDVGQGDCIYFRTPAGKHYLIDGGSLDHAKTGEYRIIPFLKSQGVDRLDAHFITHPDQDHYNAFPELLAGMKTGGISIARLVLPDIREESKNKEYHDLENAAQEAGITVRYISRGQTLQEGDLSLECLHPVRDSTWPDSNAYSTVLLLQYRNFSTLFTGDVEGMGEYELTRHMNENELPQITVLKVAHHGSRNSTGEEFLAQAAPAYAIISAGYHNSYGHPHVELMERLKKSNTKVYITHKNGAITIHTDGKSMRVKPFLVADS